jgi:hypothetical protein
MDDCFLKITCSYIVQESGSFYRPASNRGQWIVSLLPGHGLNGLGIVKKEQRIDQTIHEDPTIFG